MAIRPQGSGESREAVQPTGPSDPHPQMLIGGKIFTMTSGTTVPLFNIVDIRFNDTNTGVKPPSDPTKALLTVVQPPAHGIIANGGVPVTGFSMADYQSHAVTYTDTGGGSTDSFVLRGQLMGGNPLSPTPYVINCDDYVTTTVSGNQSCAFALGGMVRGTTQQPQMGWGYNIGTYDAAPLGYPGEDLNTNPDQMDFSYTTNGPNTLLVLATHNAFYYSILASPGPPFPPAPSLTTAPTYRGVAMTRIGGSSQSINTWDEAHLTWTPETVTCEYWWLMVPTAGPGTLSIRWTGGGEHNYYNGNITPGYTAWVALQPITGADPAQPWDTNPSNLQIVTSTSLPLTVTMTPNGSDQLILPFALEVTATPEDSGTTYPSQWHTPHQGYDHAAYGWRASLDFRTAGSYIRASTTATIPVSIYAPPAQTLTDSELFLASRRDFVDLSVLENRRLFISDAGTPQWIGPYGSIPFGTSPAVYLTTLGPPNNFALNNGLSEPFNIAGTLEPAAGPGCSPYLSHPVGGPSGEPAWRLSVSDDGGRTWSTLVKPRQIGATGHYRQRLRWLKMGHFRQRSIKLECTDPVRRNIIGVYEDLTPGMG